MKDEIEEEIDAVDSDISTTLGLLDQQKAALLFPDNDFRDDNMYNKAQGQYLATTISKLTPAQKYTASTTVEELNNVISSLCKEIVGLRYRDKTIKIIINH